MTVANRDIIIVNLRCLCKSQPRLIKMIFIQHVKKITNFQSRMETAKLLILVTESMPVIDGP